MPLWITSLLFAVLVVTIPFTLILKIMLRLPRPIAASHRRWPLPLMFGLIGIITAYVTIFIRSAYYARGLAPEVILTEFLIAGLAYIFGLVLIVRQFSGVYPEFVVTTGRTGLSVRKTMYRNIKDIAEVSNKHGETRMVINTTHGEAIAFNLPTRYVSLFYDRLRQQS